MSHGLWMTTFLFRKGQENTEATAEVVIDRAKTLGNKKKN